MKIVIDIPEEEYALCKREWDTECLDTLMIAVKYGTPLPKRHGRLIDADVLDRDLENAKVNLEDALSEAFDDGLTWASEVASELPTIIEADGGDEE